MLNKIFLKNNLWIYLISFTFIAINTFCITQEFFWFNVIPLIFLVVFFSVFSLKNFLFFIVFITPLSIPLKEYIPNLDFDMALPTEPLLFGVMLLFFLKLAVEKKFDKKLLKHPISISIYFNIFWMFITSLTSSMPLVSFKFFMGRVWFLVAFYFLASQLFTNLRNIKKYIWLYIIGFLIVIFYTINRHASFGFLDQEAAAWVMFPFLNDHTIYGALLAMILPILIGFTFFSDYSFKIKTLNFILIIIFTFATILSYTRAAWLSLVGALGVWIIILLKIKFRTVLITFFTISILLFVFWTKIFIELEKNNQDSSTDFAEHIQSMTNISSDASNLERINRWNSAMRMFVERPFFGFGPGTYMFQYAPFQFSYEKTIISTNAADGGNAHSEYIGPMAESGIFGLLTLLGIIFTTIYTALKVYNNSKNKEIKMIAICIILSLITYYLHGFLNNFLDTDKASVVFWGFTAIIAVLDINKKKLIF